MIGDGYDFTVMMRCVQEMCDDGNEDENGDVVKTLSAETRVILVGAFEFLLNAFLAEDLAYRAEYGISGVKKPSPVSISRSSHGSIVGSDVSNSWSPSPTSSSFR